MEWVRFYSSKFDFNFLNHYDQVSLVHPSPDQYRLDTCAGACFRYLCVGRLSLIGGSSLLSADGCMERKRVGLGRQQFVGKQGSKYI